MATVGVKRPREDESNEEGRQGKKFKVDTSLSVFEVPELVENIIKNILKYPKVVLAISMVSKM